MKPMQRLYPKLRLHATVRGPRGITVEQAVSRAAVEIDSWSDTAFEHIDAAIGDLRGMTSMRGQAIVPGDVFKKSEVIVNLAGHFSPPLCKAAQSLCNLARKSLEGAAFDPGAVKVHVESMVLLRALGAGDSAAAAAILDGLQAVVAKAR